MLAASLRPREDPNLRGRGLVLGDAGDEGLPQIIRDAGLRRACPSQTRGKKQYVRGRGKLPSWQTTSRSPHP
jgi:hypothetical protein